MFFDSGSYSSMPRDEAAALRVAARRVSTALRPTSQHSSRNNVTSCSVGTCHVEMPKDKRVRYNREEEEEEEEGLFKAVNEVDAESDGDASVGGDEIRR